ncbi:unnamed protein product [Sphagnum tenellum]
MSEGPSEGDDVRHAGTHGHTADMQQAILRRASDQRAMDGRTELAEVSAEGQNASLHGSSLFLQGRS